MKYFHVAVFLVLSSLTSYAGIEESVKALAPNAIVLVVDNNGKTLVSQNAEKPFVPASVAKIVTAWLAMEVLGKEYRYKTRFYLDTRRVLYVRGGGDPYLVSEELALLTPKLLNATGKDPFSAMVLDTSYYPENIRIPGIKNDNEAYNALNSALAVNFNTIHAVRKGRTVSSAEKQTPITPLAVSQFQKRGPNGRGRISLSQEEPFISSLYAGELLAAFIRQSGGEVTGNISKGKVPEALKPVYVHHQSRPLTEIIEQMLLGSNNYIANQIFLEAGASRSGESVSVEKSLGQLNALIKEAEIGGLLHLVEGSGISKENRVTADGLAGILHRFEPYAGLLKKTRRGSRYKTGTLDEASTLAGYARTADHGTVRFVISLPGRTGKLRFRILSAIEKGL